jgi:hypothetical protein
MPLLLSCNVIVLAGIYGDRKVVGGVVGRGKIARYPLTCGLVFYLIN